MTRKILTDPGIRAALARARKAGKPLWIADGAMPRSHGGLQLYVHPHGAPRWYWRYSRSDGSTTRIALGAHCFDHTEGALTLTGAREAALEKAAIYLNPESRDVRAYLKQEQARQAAEREAAERAREQAQAAAAVAGKATLANLFAAYVAHLEKQERSSFRDARTMFKNHVQAAHPTLAAMPASAITSRDVVAMLRLLTEAGKGRTAAKLRAYLRAAYALAARAELDSSVPAAFLQFAVDANPVQPVAALSQFNRARERTLAEGELRAYWQALQAEPDSAVRDAQMLGLLLGGQRPTQLVRATVADVDIEARVLRLFDSKGRRTQPRVHTLPIPEQAWPVVQRCLDRAAAQQAKWLFSLYGKTALTAATMNDHCKAIGATLMAVPKARRVVREAFQQRDIRRTCETALARMGISKDVRAQIQSHGLGGVQARHYDRHDYADEKRAALSAWAAYLESAPVANVEHIGERHARRQR